MDQLIIESGSTKSEWVLFDPDGNVLSRAIAPGWNPQLGLESNQISTDCQSMIDHAQSIYFYSAGVASPITKERVIQKLNAPCKVEVFSDLEGACKASLGETSGVVGILGTGSNACYWDGTMSHHAVPSLGFILSDEGGGVDIGKELIRSYFFKEMPSDLSKAFEEAYNLEKAFVLENVYQKPYPNRYLADFSKFVSNYPHPWSEQLVKDRFTRFINKHLLPNFHKKNENIAFVGSMSFVFKDYLIEICSALHLNVIQVLKAATEGLIKYHTKQIHD
ncbi:MAG: hypothetical protein WAT92_22285 [Saprospiraceae bacterium]